MSKKRVFSIKLDFFVGFYESFLYDSDTAYYAEKNTAEYYNECCGRDVVDMNDLEVDYRAYTKDVVEAIVDVYPQFMPDGLVESIKFRNMWSPREYNYATDEIYVKAKLSKTWRSQMRAFMKENAEWLRDRIFKDWTSYDGFISFMDNNLNDWYYHIFTEMDERYIGSMITYMMIVQGKENGEDDLAYRISCYALEDICMDCYVKFNDRNAKRRYEYAMKEAEKLWK